MRRGFPIKQQSCPFTTVLLNPRLYLTSPTTTSIFFMYSVSISTLSYQSILSHVQLRLTCQRFLGPPSWPYFYPISAPTSSDCYSSSPLLKHDKLILTTSYQCLGSPGYVSYSSDLLVWMVLSTSFIKFHFRGCSTPF